MYTLYGKTGSGSAAIEAALLIARQPFRHRRNGVVGAERCLCGTARGQSARTDPDAGARRRHRAVRKRRNPDPSRHRPSRQQAAAARSVRARTGGAWARLHRRQLLRGDQHHRLPGALVRRGRRRRSGEGAHPRGHAGAAASSLGNVCRRLHRYALPWRQRLERARSSRRRRQQMVGGSPASGASPTGFPRNAAADRVHPDVAPVFARHWPPR